MMQGQTLPSLEVAPEISKGRLANGMDYYLVTNGSEKGFADFALVQKGLADVATGRSALSYLPHFGSRSPYRFLSDYGVGYSEDGFIRHYPDAAVFSFAGIPMHDKEVSDSTLMLLFDIAASSRKPQAVVISGDISAKAIEERMDLLSMMVHPLDKNVPGEGYIWNPRDTLSLRYTFNPTSEVAVIYAIVSAQRLQREMMNTPVPLVSRTFATELGLIVRKRLADAFEAACIPLGDVGFRYVDSSQGTGDEHYSLSLHTTSKDLDEATAILASTLSSIDKFGPSLAEFTDARDRYISEIKREAGGGRLSNAEYVDKCVSSYLYGSNLASEASVNSFIVRRRLDAPRELELFNDFAKALLDSASNLTLRYDVPEFGVDRTGIAGSFNKAWGGAKPSESVYRGDFGDTLSLYAPSAKVKLRSETAEPVSGGKLWTFSNGIRVVYKQTDSRGEFHYALLLSGGLASVPGLKRGESAFVDDMLLISDVAGLRGGDFGAMLNANGIVMQTRATLSDFRISGVSPRSKLPLLMRSLLSLSGRRTVNRDSFEYYKDCERIRIGMKALSPRDFNSLMDSVMRPEYYYTDRKVMANLQDDLPERADAYFDNLFSKVNDGILVFVGDLDEEVLKKELCRTLGDFGTSRSLSRRPNISSRFATGSITCTENSSRGLVGGAEIGVNVAMSAAIPFSMANYMSFLVAGEAIRKQIVTVMADQGAYTEMSTKMELFPAERFTIFINCRPCRKDGLPSSVPATDPLKMLDAIRTVTGSLSSVALPAADLKTYKASLLDRIGADMSNPETVIRNVLARYSDGKDLVSGYKAAVNGVTKESVRSIIDQLRAGAEVEYVIL